MVIITVITMIMMIKYKEKLAEMNALTSCHMIM